MTNIQRNKNGTFDERSFFTSYFGFDVLDITNITGKEAPGKVVQINETTAYATSNLRELGVPLPEEVNASVMNRIKRSKEGIGGLALKTLVLVQELDREKDWNLSEDSDWINSEEGKKIINLTIDYYVKNGIDNAVLSPYTRRIDYCPQDPVIVLRKVAVESALAKGNVGRALRTCYRSQHYIEGAEIAKKTGHEKIAEWFYRKGLTYYLPIYTTAYGNKGTYLIKSNGRKKICAEKLGLTSLLRFMDLRKVVEYKWNHKYILAAEKLEELNLIEQANEMYENALLIAEPIKSLPEPKWGRQYPRNQDEILYFRSLLVDGINAAKKLNKFDKAEEFKSRMIGHRYFPEWLKEK